MNKRLSNLRKKIKEKSLDAVFITQAENRRYLSGFHGTAGYLLISAKNAILATDFRYIEQAGKEAPDFEILHTTSSLADWFPVLLDDLNIKRIGFEGTDITFDFFRQLRNTLRKKNVITKLTPIIGFVESLRIIKEASEIEFIKKASAIADASFEKIEKLIIPGMTEKQIAWELEKRIREKGSQSLPFDIIVGSGPQAALPHAKPSDGIINNGEPIVIDMGAKSGGYATDMTRTICIGKANAQFKKIYNTVLEAQATAMSRISAGMTGHEADAIAREIIQKAGYGEHFGHSLGHGVGLQEHESPRLGPNSKDELADGMVFTVEPGIYLTGWGGVRIEDTVVMQNGKAIPLTRTKKMTL